MQWRLLLQVKPKRKPAEKPDARPLTQAELLAEAAYTELDNLRSLEAHLAAEEEFKKKAAVKRSKYSGPLIRFRSKSINNEAVVSSSGQKYILGADFSLIICIGSLSLLKSSRLSCLQYAGA